MNFYAERSKFMRMGSQEWRQGTASAVPRLPCNSAASAAASLFLQQHAAPFDADFILEKQADGFGINPMLFA